MKYEEIAEFDTKLTADVVDWQPKQSHSASSNVLACGTYFLDKEQNQRLGYLYFINVDLASNSLQVLNTVNYETSGILDLKWTDSQHMVSIDSQNVLRFYAYENENNSIELLDAFKINSDASSSELSVGLTLDYARDPSDGSLRVQTSDTQGFVNIFSVNSSKASMDRRFKAHDYEVWSVLIDKNEPNVVYSGADDCLLKMWDLREPTSKVAGKCSVFEGGVCSIIHPQRDDRTCLGDYSSNNLLCGSYDERIYVLDRRNLKSSVKTSKKLDGGVWKMKLNAEKGLLLCACMHTGVHLVDLSTLQSELYYDGHGLNNLAYGCDWCPNKFQPGRSAIATCSFYNHSLRVWNLVDDVTK
jgi:diphthamide biosynthesis protein 7